MSVGRASEDDESAAISITEAARLLGVSASTARKLAAVGELPGLIPGKLGSQWRVNRQALLDYVNAPLKRRQ